MIRFIDLTGQIDDEFQFAWWNTIVDKFLEFDQAQTWYSWEDFEADFRHEERGYVHEDYLERLRALFPKKPKSKI